MAEDIIRGTWFTHEDYLDMEERKHVVIPSRYTIIAPRAFYNSEVRTVIMDGVRQIKAEAFFGCKKLIYIRMTGIYDTIIGDRAFKNCTRLKLSYITPNVSRIGEEAFMNCTGITRLVLDRNIEDTSDSLEHRRLNYTRRLWIKARAFTGCANLTDVVINGNPRVLGYAFQNCALKTLTANGTPDFQDQAFLGCDLQYVHIRDDNVDTLPFMPQYMVIVDTLWTTTRHPIKYALGLIPREKVATERELSSKEKQYRADLKKVKDSAAFKALVKKYAPALQQRLVDLNVIKTLTPRFMAVINKRRRSNIQYLFKNKLDEDTTNKILPFERPNTFFDVLDNSIDLHRIIDEIYRTRLRL